MTRVFDLWRRARPAARDATPDSELLARFLRHRDEAAFAALVDRHGPLVYGACRRLLPDPADAEDAFQVTFLVLVRRAGSLGTRPVGPWLHRVAVWTARNVRRRNAARVAAARPLGEPTAPPSTAAVDARLDVDAAVSSLPPKYRVPLVLCHLQGWTRRELAEHLGCPESTVSSRLGRGLAMLRRRFAGRDPAVVLAVAGAVAVPPGLASTAVRAAAIFRTSSLSAAASPAVADLTEGVLRMFRVKKLAAAGLVFAAVAAVGLAVGLTGGAGPRAEAQDRPKPLTAAPPAPPDDLKAASDRLDRELADLKARLKKLEDQKAELDAAMKRRADAAPKEPHIVVWVRPSAQRVWDPASGRALSVPPYREVAAGPPQEFAVGEFDASGKQAVTAWCADLDSLKVYLTRAKKDPAAPKKLLLRFDATYPADRTKAVVDACKAAGFDAVSAEVIPAGDAPKGPKGTGKAPLTPYVIEPPDVLQIEVSIRDGDKPRSLVTGDVIVRPDGTVRLGGWGSVAVNGLTTEGAAGAIRRHLAASPDLKGVPAEHFVVTVDVLASNSKRYYVIATGPNGSENVLALPMTGNETVLDAVTQVAGPSGVPGIGDVRLVRRGPDGKPDATLPVDWDAITARGNTATNYQLLPGDRVYIKPKK